MIAAAGNIACDPSSSSFHGGAGSSGSCRERYTSDLLVSGGFAAALALGDNQYYCGSYTACDSTNASAAGYFKYFGAAAGQPGHGYYSFDVESWHLIALNSNCSEAGGCGAGSAQYTWLQNDLAASRGRCLLAYWHIPLFSSGGRASSNSRPFWDLLYAANADVVLNGRDHIYERFAPQSPAGAATAGGIREFIAGTGDSNHTSIAAVAANSELRNATTFGLLELTLNPASYDWRFVPEVVGTFTDSGSAAWHRGSGSTDTIAPKAPGGFRRRRSARPKSRCRGEPRATTSASPGTTSIAVRTAGR